MKSNIRNIITALILLFPVWAHAEVHTGIELAKTATYDYATQTGVIKLENFVGQVTKKMNLGQPADVVLVLDGSGSMNKVSGSNYWNMDDLCDAVDLFAGILRDACTSTVHHRISMIIYGGNSKLLCDFTDVDTDDRVTSTKAGYTASTEYYEFSGLIKNQCGFTTSGGKTYVNTYTSGTMTQMALGHASYIITKETDIADGAIALSTVNNDWETTWITTSSPTGARTGSTCNRYVVLMTDGALSGRPKNQSGASIGTEIYEEDETGTPNNTVSEDQAVFVANALKAAGDLSTTIYTVGFLRNADAKPGVNNCLNNISSNNRPDPADAVEYAKNDSDYPVDKIPHDYYIRIERTTAGTSGTDLENIFKMISGEVVAGCAAVDLDYTTTKITDVINGSVFKLPAGITDDATLLSNITAYTVPCIGYDQMADDPYEFDESTHNAVPSGVTFNLTNVSTNPTITVSGFDYSANWCGEKYKSGSISGGDLVTEATGCKLVIEIPYTVKSYTGGFDDKVPTNLTGSQFSGNIKGTSPTETLKQAYPEPSVALYELTIQRTGLKAGESAIYKITKGSDLLYTVVLTGTGSTVQQKVLYVPDGSVVVTETGWGWANVPTSPSLTKVIGPSPNNAPTYSFSGSNSGVKNPEDVKKNEFDQ